MKVDKYNQVFNLFNTNGRRSDVINAYKIYTNTLEDVYNEVGSNIWTTYPNNLTQFRFYERAIQQSPEVFKIHSKYDKIKRILEDQDIREAFETRDIKRLEALTNIQEFYKDLDNGIEDRARHYTSNLVKIGLADESRQISPIGKSWIHGRKLLRSRFEKLLPIDDTNLMFFRQLMKLRIYSKDGNKYYSPALLAIYILLKHERVSQDLFITMIQMLNPSIEVDPATFVSDFLDGQAQIIEREYIPYHQHEALDEIMNESTPMAHETFSRFFSSRKSNKSSLKNYQAFYESLITFNDNQTANNLESLYHLLSDKSKKDQLNKAFGFGRNIFNFDKRDPIHVGKFMELNSESDLLSNEGLNKRLYLQFQASKRHDGIQEYGETTRRVLKVTGVISFKNGIVELKYRDLWREFFSSVNLEELIFRDSTEEEYVTYEKEMNSPFFNHVMLEDIFNFNEDHVEKVVFHLKSELGVKNDEDIKDKLYSQASEDFIKHVEKNYPKDKIIEILPLFSDRNNDKKIKDIVSKDSDVPTIFEFIIGIAWYHISAEKYDLLSSLNLSMSADFEPETHAGGGVGDIIVEYEDYVLMLEVTLMNKQAQKRGEWEPVLRHATNLTIDSAPKEVITLFIADELDANTINIWRAVATVPLQSSKKTGEFTDSVTIMPLKNGDILEVLKQNIDDTKFLEEVRKSFRMMSSNFKMNWREDILKQVNL